MLKKSSLFLSALALLLGAASAQDIVDEIIARVNNSIITRADYERAKQTTQQELQQQFPNDWQSKWDSKQKEVLRELIDRQLLLEKGKELGITGDTEVVKRLNEMRQKMNLPSMDALEEEAKKQGISFEDFKEETRAGIVEEQVIGHEVGSKIHISEEEVQDFYDKHKQDMEGPEEVSLSEILVSTQPAKPSTEAGDANKKTGADEPLPEDPAKVAQAEAKAKSLLEQLSKGAKFEDLAKSSSDGPTAADGGRLGVFKRGELAKDFEDKTFNLKQGETTDVIRTKQGFLILKVNGRRAAGIPPLKEVDDNIRQAIYSQKLEPAARAFLTKLREQAYIDVKSGYTDTGASPNQTNKPVIMAAANDGSVPAKQAQKKKKKKLGVF
ncbi:MAG TPA: peptidylprolyl isomerase [Candidatus Angelobacter sp.]|nr:peptidylprolyl isomerase [Candidatus Angelobacter sp.]